MNDFDNPNCAEYIYSKKACGKLLIRRILMITGYVLFLAVYFAVCYISRVIPVFALAPLFLWIIIFFTWRLVSYDCYAELIGGKLTLGRIKRSKNGNKKTAEIVITVREALCIMPAARYNESVSNAKQIYDLSSSKKSARRVAIEFAKENSTAVAFFDSTAHINRLLTHSSVNAVGLSEMNIR